MSNVRVVSFDGLRERLRLALGADSTLFEQFDRALKAKDDTLVSEAMDCLSGYPEETRSMVQNVMLSWLFEGSDAAGLEHMPTVGKLPN